MNSGDTTSISVGGLDKVAAAYVSTVKVDTAANAGTTITKTDDALAQINTVRGEPRCEPEPP